MTKRMRRKKSYSRGLARSNIIALTYFALRNAQNYSTVVDVYI